MGGYRKANLADLEQFIAEIRIEDRQECEAMLGKPEIILPGAVLHPSTLAIVNTNGDVIGLFGCYPLTGHKGVGVIWMLVTDRIHNHKIEFLRKARDVVNGYQEEYPILWNYTDARNTFHHRWLKWCGFTFVRKHESMGTQCLPFYEIIRI